MAGKGGNGGTATANLPAVQTVAGVVEVLNKYVAKIDDALPKSIGMTGMQFIDMAVLAIRRMEPRQRNAILHCRKDSILFAIQESASLGLRLGGSMAEGYLIPYGEECQFQPSYHGLLKLARRSRAFQTIEVVEVRHQDEFRVFRDPEAKIHHAPAYGIDRGPTTGVYAYCVNEAGRLAFEYMDRPEIEKVRRQSKAPNSPAWANWFDQMGMKAVLKRLLKRQERSVELSRAIEADDREYEGERPQNGHDITKATRGVAGLAAQLGIEEEHAPPEPEAVEGCSDTAVDIDGDPDRP